MKQQTTVITAIAVLVLSVASTQAQDWSKFGNYTDAKVTLHFDNSVPPAAILPPNFDANTFADPASTVSINAYTSDGDTATYGGFRWLDQASPYGNTGGGANRAYGGNLYFMRSDYSPIGSPDGYTRITGNLPNTEYTIAMYSIQGGAKDTVSYSLDQGVTWSSGAGIIDQPVIQSMLWGGADWLAHSTTDAIGTPTGIKDGDTRYRIILGTMISDANGDLVVGFRDPNWRSTGGTSDRGRIDGFAVALGQVPEPTSMALAGLGAAAMLIFRRRK